MQRSSTKPLRLPVSEAALDVLLDYIYTDECDKLNNADVDTLTEVLFMTDQFLQDRLSTMAAEAMIRHICMRNVVEILMLSSSSNAYHLKEACMEYISINLPFMLENRYE